MVTLVFGLDGGNWPLVEPLLEDGSLPNIRRLRNEGLWGVSRSVLPPTTCPNWKCYASSRGPGAHDVYWWEQVNKETFDVGTPDSGSFNAPELWDYLNDAGKTTGVVNLPMSYPPRELDGFMISGGPPTKEDGYTSPASLETELEADGYRVHSNTTVDGETGRGVEETLELIRLRFETARHLLDERDPDFLHLTIFYLNVLQHHFWDGQPVKRAWQLIDEQLGGFLDEGHTIFLMSDHGCTSIETTFYINEWLEQQGHLTLDSSAADYMMKAGLTQERLGNLVSSLGLKRAVRRLVPGRLLRQLPHDEGIKHEGKFNKVNFDASVAVGSGQGLIYLLVPPESTEYERVRKAIIDGLSELTTPAGIPIATTIHRGEDLYSNGDPIYRPDIIFEQGQGFHTFGAVGHGQVMDTPDKWRAENAPDGLFLAHGKTVATRGDIGTISILDIAPTVLYSMEEAIPDDFEGNPLQAVNEPRGEPTYREPLPGRGKRASEIGDAARERLADIGYIE